MANANPPTRPDSDGKSPPIVAKYTPAEPCRVTKRSIIQRLKQSDFMRLDDHLVYIRKSAVGH